MGRHKRRLSERPSGECEMLKVNHQLEFDLNHWLNSFTNLNLLVESCPFKSQTWLERAKIP
jgi:hypothetical protein